MKDMLLETFPKMGNALLAEISEHATPSAYREGESIPPELFKNHQLILTSGCVKVLEKIRGQNLLLYRVRVGEKLNLPVSKLDKDISWYVELDSELIAIPDSVSRSWVCSYPSWRAYLENNHKITVSKLLDTLWHSGDCLENRILAYLGDLADTQQSETLHITHLEIAEEIGSVREVVSRSLKKLEQAGKLELKRGKIILHQGKYQSAS